MNQDQVKGRIEEAKGKVKEVTGKVIGNKDLEEEVSKKHRRPPSGLWRS